MKGIWINHHVFYNEPAGLISSSKGSEDHLPDNRNANHGWPQRAARNKRTSTHYKNSVPRMRIVFYAEWPTNCLSCEDLHAAWIEHTVTVHTYIHT